MSCTKIKYRCGDTIKLYFKGDSAHDLDTNTFKAVIYSDLEPDLVIDKSEMVKSGDNEYYLEIDNTKTKELQAGQYTLEVLFGDTETSILDPINFDLSDSHAKEYIQ